MTPKNLIDQEPTSITCRLEQKEPCPIVAIDEWEIWQDYEEWDADCLEEAFERAWKAYF